MTLFQAILSSIIGVISEIYPIAPGAHQSLLEHFFGWNVSHPRLQGAIELGVLFGLLVALRHDVLAHISALIQIVIFRKKPRAMDERIPVLILLALIPSAAAFFFLRRLPVSISSEPLLFAAIFGLSAIPMAFFDYYSKKMKSIYDWNALDAFLIGAGSAALAIPEIGRTAGAYTLSSALGYRREGAAKFIFYLAIPLMGISAWYHLKGPGSALAISELPTLYFWTSVVVSFFTSLFLIHVFLNQIQRMPLLRFAVYRLLIAGAIVGMHLYRS
jgi:undecaprenyl pyrophosphate phosphatase UppP